MFGGLFRKAKRSNEALRSGVVSTGTLLRSVSDNDQYPEFALQAALNLQVFSQFRNNRTYGKILEHVSAEAADSYLEIIQDQHGLSERDILQIIEPLQAVGNPKLRQTKKLGVPVSTSAIRYLKTALDIRTLAGSKLPHVAEIGCGYGGQSVILGQLINIDLYTFIDLWQMNLLIQRFIEVCDVSFSYQTLTSKQINEPVSADFVISNYAFSELPTALQDVYLQKVIVPSKHGYMTMNSGVSGKFGQLENHGQSELLSRISGAVVEDTKPRSLPDNYLLRW